VTIRRLVIALAFLGIIFMAIRPMIDTDTWWHLRTGQWIMENQALPDVDRFSLTRSGEPWYYPGWMSEILMFQVFSLGGLAALNLLFTGVILLAFVLVYWSMDGNPFAVAAVLVVAAGASEIFWSARPQLFTFLFSAGFYLILRKFLWGKKNALWILPLIMALWVNIHPGFAVGFILVSIALIAQAVNFLSRRESHSDSGLRLIWLAGTLLACLAAAALNPRGPAVLAYPFQTVSIRFLQNFIQEWGAPDFHYWTAQLFLILFILTWTVVAFSPKKLEADDFFFLVIVGYMGFLAWRNTNLLSIVAPAIIMRYGQPLLEKHFPDWNPDHAVSRAQSAVHIGAVTLIATAALIFGVSVLSPESIRAAVDLQLPVAAVDHLAAHPVSGGLFNSYNFGSYLLWKLPESPVFVDGRTDLYNDEILDQYLTVIRAQEGWRDILERWQIHVVFVEPSTPILQLLAAEGWTVYYEDSQAVILVSPAS
jgi:branched-subunit amino acid transport protein AzlD